MAPTTASSYSAGDLAHFQNCVHINLWLIVEAAELKILSREANLASRYQLVRPKILAIEILQKSL
jgi:hypothetical protein